MVSKPIVDDVRDRRSHLRQLFSCVIDQQTMTENAVTITQLEVLPTISVTSLPLTTVSAHTDQNTF